MRRTKSNKTSEELLRDAQSSDEDLYVQDLPSSLTQRMNNLVLNDHEDDDSNENDPPGDAQDSDLGDLGLRPDSPHFERPYEWRAIDAGHCERTANEREADAEIARAQDVYRIEKSLLFRKAIINRALQRVNDLTCVWMVPPQWRMDGLRGDLTRHPSHLERYLNQEVQILCLIEKRMALLMGQDDKETAAKTDREVKLLVRALRLRLETHGMHETKLLIGNMLAFKMDLLIFAVENGIRKAPGTPPVSDLPTNILDIIIRDEDLYHLLTKLWEQEQEHFPDLFLGKRFPELIPNVKPSPSPPSPPGSNALDGAQSQTRVPESKNPPSFLLNILREAGRMLSADYRMCQSGDAFVRQKPSITEQWLSFDACNEMSQWPELKKRLNILRDLEHTIFPERFPTPAIDMARLSSVAEEPGEPGDDNDRISTSISSQPASPSDQLPEGSIPSESSHTFIPGAQSQHQTSDGSSSRSDSSRTDKPPSLQSSETLSLGSPPLSGPASSSMQLSLRSSETRSPSSRSRSMPNSSLQPSTNVPPTPILSPDILSPGFSPPSAVTPVPSRADSNIVKASPIPASRLKYRLEVEKRKSMDGTVQQMRFGGEEILPGVTPSESSTSRVHNWLDGSHGLGGPINQGNDVMIEDTLSLDVEQQSEQELDTEEQQLTRVTSDNQDREYPSNQEIEAEQGAGWDSLTEEEKERRRDSAYKSRQGSLADPSSGRR